MSDNCATGVVYDVQCRICGDWMEAHEFIILGKRCHPTIHPRCEQKALEIVYPNRKKKTAPPATTKPSWNDK